MVVAQYQVLATFLAALIVSSGAWRSSGLSDLALGIILMVVNLVALIWAGCVCYNLYSREHQRQRWRRGLNINEVAMVEALLGDIDNVNTDSAQLLVKDSKTATTIETNGKNHDNDDRSLLKQIALNANDIIMLKRLGAGSFGEVFRGQYLDQSVAVKTMLVVTEETVKAFRSEILLTVSL